MGLRAIAFAMLTSLLAVPAVAQTPPAADPGPPLSGYPQKALRLPTPSELKTATYVRDVIYGHKEGVALTYDVFKPKKPNGALVVNMVSAGWRSSWGKPEERQARYQGLIDKGFTVVALYHGSAPRFGILDAVNDVRLGLRHIKLHAKEYGADPNRIGVWGASAGGHLALVASAMGDDGDPSATDPLLRGSNRVRAVVAYYPPADLREFVKGRDRTGLLNFKDEDIPKISPILSVDPKDPPTLILQGDADKVVPPSQAAAMHAAFDKAGVENKLETFAGADHDFYIRGDPAKTDAYCTDAYNRMVEWFQKHL
ncbi:MAG TPA: alpha/beta hydrolase [Hyphomonadaceae bacterium]|nr:alpha/beta hydrolase [Hyphomonadaceae bacterium]